MKIVSRATRWPCRKSARRNQDAQAWRYGDAVFETLNTKLIIMAAPIFTSPAFRLIRTLDLFRDDGTRKLPIRIEIFQDPKQLTHFRYRLWGVEWFKLQTEHYPEPLPHELLTTLCMPNLGANDYFEAEDVDAAEQKVYEYFKKEFGRCG